MEPITIGKYIKQLREEKSITGYYMDKMGFSKSTLSRIEDDSRVPAPDTLQQIAKILEINYLELYKVAGYIDNDTVIDYVTKNKLV